jgi:hypothetical protein
MPTTDVVEPDEHTEDELPSKFLIFACPDLGPNEGKAREAGAEIQNILCDIIDSVCDLEHIERVLREAEPASARARRAREQLLRALSETNGLVVGVGSAWDALTFHWNTEHHHDAGLALSVAHEIEVTSGGTFLDLDNPAVRRLAADDPTAFVRDLPEPIVIDEFQRVPDVLAAIKAELNRDRRPGRYVLAGSARQVVPELADFLTGRVELLTLWPFAMTELVPGAASVADRLFDGSALRHRRASGTPRRAAECGNSDEGGGHSLGRAARR